MKYLILVVTCSFLFISQTYSQSVNVDSLVRKNVYLSVQANQLVRQVLNFGGNQAAQNNPYLINLSFNNRLNGWGMNFGLGYTITNFNAGDDFNSSQTNIADFNFRLGPDYKKYVSKKIVLGYGIDLLFRHSKNYTEVINRVDFNQRVGVSSNIINSGFGFGPRGTLMIHLNKYIVLGTESTYYLRFMKVTNISETFSLTGTSSNKATISEDEDVFKNRELNPIMPAVIYLIVRF
jgi:hypothetical protein